MMAERTLQIRVFFLIYELFKLLRWSNFLPFTVTLCYSVNLINRTPKYRSCHKRGYANTTFKHTKYSSKQAVTKHWTDDAAVPHTVFI